MKSNASTRAKRSKSPRRPRELRFEYQKVEMGEPRETTDRPLRRPKATPSRYAAAVQTR